MEVFVQALANVVLFTSGVLVLMMQPGFMLLESGVMSNRNVINNIFKNMIDLCIVAAGFIFFGFDIVNGSSPITPAIEAIGQFLFPSASATAAALAAGSVGGENEVSATASIGVFFQAVFAATAITICSGSVTGRILPLPYMLFSLVFGSLVYPALAFHVWNSSGSLYGQFTDFAGSMVVHGVGGFAGLAGAVILGPRLGRCGYYGGLGAKHAEELAARHKPNNIPLAALGVFLLWIGWYGFNGGTAFAGSLSESGLEETFSTFGVIIINTTIAPACAVLCVLVIAFSGIVGDRIYITHILNAVLTGLVGITAACDIVTSAEAALIGFISGGMYVVAQEGLLRAGVDDPVGAFPVHGIGGLIGVAAVAFGGSGNSGIAYDVLGTQLYFGIVVAAISFTCAYITFFLSGVIGLMIAPDILLGKESRKNHLEQNSTAPFVGFIRNKIRYSGQYERTGLDLAVHGQRAYNGNAD